MREISGMAEELSDSLKRYFCVKLVGQPLFIHLCLCYYYYYYYYFVDYWTHPLFAWSRERKVCDP